MSLALECQLQFKGKKSFFFLPKLIAYLDLDISSSFRIRGHVQSTWTEFWAILTPSPYVDTFIK